MALEAELNRVDGRRTVFARQQNSATECPSIRQASVQDAIVRNARILFMVFPRLVQVHANWPQPGQPDPYFLATASARSTPTTLAIVASQASTSANSPS